MDKQQNNCVYLYAPLVCKGPELAYMANYVFVERLGFSAIEIIYESRTLKGGYHVSIYSIPLTIFCSDFFENYIDYLNGNKLAQTQGNGKTFLLFPNEGGFDVNFDIFAACFCLLNRIEEVNGTASFDEHNRFKSSSSVLVKHAANRLPIIDFWMKSWRNKLAEKGLKLRDKEHFTWWNTLDIDQIFAQKGKPLYVQLGALMKSIINGRFSTFKALINSFFGGKDPFDVLELMAPEKGRNIIFLLCGGNTKYDLKNGRNDEGLAYFVKKYQEKFEIGIHPSYMSSVLPDIFKNEREKLANFSHAEIDMSRQHYLRFQWPQTQLQLGQNGIKQDFSMGFSDEIGFRSGTSRPYLMYDLYQRKPTQISIVPFCVMDISLKNYKALSPKMAWVHIKELIDNVMECNGLFVSLWHHESLSGIDDWSGWKEVYFNMKKYMEECL